MKVSQALDSRITCRAFLPREVPESLVRELLERSARAPSGGNLQPWRVWAVAGKRLELLKENIREQIKTNVRGEGTEYPVYPEPMFEPFIERRRKCGEDMYALLEIPRENRLARLGHFLRNFELFGAPVGLFFAIDRKMGVGQWADLGMYVQSVMLLAREYGLSTAAQEAWAVWHKTLQEFLPIPDELMLFCGMALGYADEAAPVNALRTDRAPLAEFAELQGF